MISIFISLFVTAAMFGTAVILGFRLERTAKPYPFTVLIPHIVLFFLIAIGIGACMNKIDAVLPGMSKATIALCFAGPALILCLLSGVVMIFLKQKNRGWIFVHKLAMYWLGVSLLSSGLLAALRW